jgi:hypothetical protein
MGGFFYCLKGNNMSEKLKEEPQKAIQLLVDDILELGPLREWELSRLQQVVATIRGTREMFASPETPPLHLSTPRELERGTSREGRIYPPDGSLI